MLIVSFFILQNKRSRRTLVSLPKNFMKKKFLPLLATIIITATALLPLGIQKAEAVSYYPTYSCYYRDISGSCLSYQTSNPYHLRLTYPFNSMFNASAVQPSTWNNRYSNSQYRNFRYEGNGEWRNYYDEGDTYYEYESTRTYCTGRDCRSYNR